MEDFPSHEKKTENWNFNEFRAKSQEMQGKKNS
jgi:hypothetical protein